MKYLIIFILLANTSYSKAQTWHTFSMFDTYEEAPFLQFVINPYKNDIWFVGYTQIAVLESDGQFQVFPESFSPPFLWGGDKYMTFTPAHVYYAHNNYGLFKFDNYVPQQQYNFTDYYGKLYSNNDTIYIVGVEYGSNNLTAVFDGSGGILTDRNGYDLAVKNSFLYEERGSNTTIVYYPDETNNFIPISTTDPQYLGGQYNEMKFSRLTDTLYVGGKTGISLAYNYDFFDSITPNNTTNMPSPNVLEMEWDMNDNLWAVFGTPTDEAFAIARLENDTWVNRIDASNSPIDFDDFIGLEIDTLSNLWVVDNTHLHTLITPNSPEWLSALELESSANFSLFPNPSSGTIHIEAKNKNVTAILIYDLSGRKMEEHVYANTIQTTLSSGTYILQLKNEDEVVGQEKIVVR